MHLLVNIDVDELARAMDFYTRAFDLVIGRRFGDAGVELLGASSTIYLLVKYARQAPPPLDSLAPIAAPEPTPSLVGVQD